MLKMIVGPMNVQIFAILYIMEIVRETHYLCYLFIIIIIFIFLILQISNGNSDREIIL